MLKIARHARLIVLALCLIALLGCAGQKAAQKTSASPVSETALVANGPDEVRKSLGEPSTVSKTVDGHILWVYTPSWKLMPNLKGTVYVEFENDKVIRVFRLK